MERKYNKKSSKYKKIIFFLVYVGIFFIGKTEAVFSEKALNICIIESLNIQAYNSARRGFLELLGEKGYREGDNLILDYYLIRDGIKSIVEDIKEKKPDLILTIGTEATQKIWEEEIRDIPVIFLMVLDPEKNGFVKSNQKSGNNFTGSAMKIPVNMYLKAIKSVFPDVEKIGVIYNSLNAGDVVERADFFAQENEIELIWVSVLSPKNLPDALDGLVREVDILWIIPGNTAIGSQSLSYILSVTFKKRIPVMVYAIHIVKKGALMGVSCDYEDIGRQGGELFWKVLNGETPATLPVTVPRKVFLSVNVRVAERMQIDIPTHVLEEAYKVFN